MINIDKVYTKNIAYRLVFLVIALVLGGLLFNASPDIKFPLVIYKLTLVTLGAVLGYYLDMLLFPNFRPKDIAQEIDTTTDITHLTGLYKIAGASVIRRSIVVSACILAIALGL